VLGAVEGAYVVRDRDPRIILNYLREIGPREVLRKVISRTGERLRNEKYVSCGLGTVVESRSPAVRPGDDVVFLAPFHPRCANPVVLDVRFVRPVPGGRNGADGHRAGDGTILFNDLPAARDDPDPPACRRWAAWSEFSGIDVAEGDLQACLAQIERDLRCPVSGPSRVLKTRPEPITERSPGVERPKGRGMLDAILFGYGNYAKTAILPNLDRRIRLMTIHEVDPAQVGRASRFRCRVDSAGLPREDETADVYFIAGFHHTHAELALHALERGACAVVEKPLATTFDQLARLTHALNSTSGRFFSGFHKRYSAMNRYIRRDLGLEPGSPVSCHCLVLEIPLPRLHWYRWPNSGSRIVANGCHWIDHFLFLNGFSPPVSGSVHAMSNGDVTVALELANGASFSMSLTDVGSARIGVQEYVEFRAGDATVSVRNSRHYHAETTRAVLRRKTFDKLSPYGVMYREITRRIASGEPGDDADSLRVSTSTVLELEALYHATVGENGRWSMPPKAFRPLDRPSLASAGASDPVQSASR
jgi:predicted dehydrogenase